MQPTTVWIILGKDFSPDGDHSFNSLGCFYQTEASARTEYENLNPVLRKYFSVEECVIMSASQYNPG